MLKRNLEDYERGIGIIMSQLNIDLAHPKACRRKNVFRKAGDNWGAIADYNQAITLDSLQKSLV